jgi:hypothetical protein
MGREIKGGGGESLEACDAWMPGGDKKASRE